jgi:GNAT superfamily N-acetyltransferase
MICEVDGKAVGFALCFYNFSTFLGRPGIYLEDIYVQPAYRGRGIGRAVIKRIAAKAKAEGCGRIEWSVLNWNKPAVDFYRSLGAVPMSDWHVERLSGEALDNLAA